MKLVLFLRLILDTRNDSTGNDSEEEVKAEADNRLNREMVDDCSLDSEAKKEVEAELERDVDDEDDDDEVIDEEEDDRLEQDQLHKSVVKTNRDAPTTRLTRSHGRPKRVQAHVPARFEAQVLVPVEDDDENDDAFTETVQYFKDKVRRYPGTSFSNHKTRMETDDDDDDDDEGDKDDEMEDDVDDDEDEDDEEEIDEEEDEPKTNGLIDLDDGDEDDDDVEADDEIGDEMEEEPLGRPINQYQAQSRSSKRIAKSATSSRSLIQNRTRLVKSKRLQRSAGSNGGRKMNGMNEVNTSMNGNSQRRALSAANGMNGNGLTNGSKVTSLGSNSNIKGKSSGSCSDKSAKGNAFQDVLQELKVKEQKTR